MSTILKTDKAPAAIGPYSQGVQLGNMVITSGQIPLDPVTGTFSDNIEVQARQSLMNVKAVVEAAGFQVRVCRQVDCAVRRPPGRHRHHRPHSLL